MRKILISFFVVVVIFLIFAPSAFAAIVPDCTGEEIPKGGGNLCTIKDLLGKDGLIDNGIDFMLFYLAIPLATLSIAIAGFKLIMSGANPGERDKAKKIMWYAIIGLLIAFTAWLIIDLILKALISGNFNPPLEP